MSEKHDSEAREMLDALEPHMTCRNLHCGDSSRCWDCDGCRQKRAFNFISTALAQRDEARAKAIEAAKAIVAAKVQRCRDAVANCSRWSPAQAEWSRARDACLDIADELDALTLADKTEGEG